MCTTTYTIFSVHKCCKIIQRQAMLMNRWVSSKRTATGLKRYRGMAEGSSAGNFGILVPNFEREEFLALSLPISPTMYRFFFACFGWVSYEISLHHQRYSRSLVGPLRCIFLNTCFLLTSNLCGIFSWCLCQPMSYHVVFYVSGYVCVLAWLQCWGETNVSE